MTMDYCESCDGPLYGGVCPRNPAHTPQAWIALTPLRRGIFPGLPRNQSPELCDAYARKGTGTGSCARPLDAHGQCDRANAHITP